MIASIAGLIVAMAAQKGHGFDRHRVVAFGPYLALAIWISWLAIAIAVP
jgi:prepilin signal peptidase PulO-like enzyme (type II secretory pathway)